MASLSLRAVTALVEALSEHRISDAARMFDIPLAVYLGTERLVVRNSKQMERMLADYQDGVVSTGTIDVVVIPQEERALGPTRRMLRIEKQHKRADDRLTRSAIMTFYFRMTDMGPKIEMMESENFADLGRPSEMFLEAAS